MTTSTWRRGVVMAIPWRIAVRIFETRRPSRRCAVAAVT